MKNTNFLAILQVIFISLKVADISTLNWYQTFIPLMIEMVLTIFLAIWEIKKTQKNKTEHQEEETKEKIDVMFK